MEDEQSRLGVGSSAPNPARNEGDLSEFQGLWIPFPSERVPSIISFQKHFQALDDDIIVASKPKAGTTWLKALVFAIANRHRCTFSNSPLNTANPHELVPYFEFTLYKQNPNPDLSNIPSPRLLATHLPYTMLAESIKRSNYRIVYIIRNPLDMVVSQWHFLKGTPHMGDWPLEDCLELFCKGQEVFGPLWDHVLGYWKESLEKPWKVLFMRYEELKKDPVGQTKRLAEFLGFPFSMEEEDAGSVEQIIDFCSFNNLKDLEVNKTGKMKGSTLPSNKVFFRTGKVGDHVNYLSPADAERFSNILEHKLSGSGFTFNSFS